MFRSVLYGASVSFLLLALGITADQTTEPESNESLQERVRKGTAYFREKIGNLLLVPLESLSMETDNKAVRKSLEKAMNHLTGRVKLQMACLEACESGFSVEIKVRP